MEYLKIWVSFAEILEPLNDSERGRLFTAMLEYAGSGALPEFKGNERFTWPAAKQAIDRARAESERLTANGSKGRRPRKNQQKPNETNENQQKPNESHKDNNNNKDKDKDNKDYHGNNNAGAWLSEEEINQSLERDRQIEEAARAWGLPCSEGNMIKARDLADKYTLAWLVDAIEVAGNGKEQTWRYVNGILKSWQENGRDAPRKKPAGKTVSAQNYQQRDYSEDELLAVSDDLIEEARANRGKTA